MRQTMEHEWVLDGAGSEPCSCRGAYCRLVQRNKVQGARCKMQGAGSPVVRRSSCWVEFENGGLSAREGGKAGCNCRDSVCRCGAFCLVEVKGVLLLIGKIALAALHATGHC